MKTCILRQTHSYILVKWRNVDYNLGNLFDGTYFTAPENGLYSFYACCSPKTSSHGYIHLYLNQKVHSSAYAVETRSDKDGMFVNIYTTLNLVKNDKVDVRFEGSLAHYNDKTITYFEGRQVARIDK